MPLDQSPVSRRTVAKGAAWGVPAVAVAAAAPSLAASHCGTQAVSISLEYRVMATAFGSQLDQGIWTVTVSTTLPACVHVGDVIPAPALSVDVTTSTDAADLMRGLVGASQITGGSASSPYSVTGAVTNPGSRDASLTVQPVAVPDSGPITTTATGAGSSETAAGSPGSIMINIADTFSGSIEHDGNATLNPLVIDGTLEPTSQNTLLGTIDVVA